MKNLIIIPVLFLSLTAFSQPDIPSEDYFDFWIGEWDLTWKDSNGSTGTGKNTITRILNDKVILESFEGLTGENSGFIGKSWTVYSPQLNQWRQTWVDNQGAYLDFQAEFEGDNRMFVRSFTRPNGIIVKQRMIFKDIEKNSFTWDWESSLDEGKTWILNWRINYKRKGS